MTRTPLGTLFTSNKSTRPAHISVQGAKAAFSVFDYPIRQPTLVAAVTTSQ
jgi:hypothetical protein